MRIENTENTTKIIFEGEEKKQINQIIERYGFKFDIMKTIEYKDSPINILKIYDNPMVAKILDSKVSPLIEKFLEKSDITPFKNE